MVNITRYDPSSDMVSLRQAMDRLFEDSWVSPLTWRTVTGETVNPLVEVHETADDIVVTASLPGLKAQDVEITMTGQSLTIKGEFKSDQKVERDQYPYRERRHGTFSRLLQLPERVQGDKAEAAFADGVLTLGIPKAEEVKPRQIQIKPGTAGSAATGAHAAAGGNAATGGNGSQAG